MKNNERKDSILINLIIPLHVFTVYMAEFNFKMSQVKYYLQKCKT